MLSNGPDPDADPVGYAQAQILPLREIDTSDANLHQAIDALGRRVSGLLDRVTARTLPRAP